jgi:4-oxalocrotonate tautomerase
VLIVTIDMISGVYSPSQKRNLFHRITEAAVEVEGEAMREQIFVKLNEVSSANWAIGGLPMELGEAENMLGRSSGDALDDAASRRLGRHLRRGI